MGKGIAVDGKYGPATKPAVKNVQNFHNIHGNAGLAVYGVYGPRTGAVMEFVNSYGRCRTNI
jgi:peptidoglycan hydrolase-like protein with peptidoglycan-binding domain